MALSYSTLVKPTSKQLIDPDTGEIRKDWDLYLKGLTERLNATIDEVVALPAPAPLDAQYIVGTANATLTAERVVTNTATVEWDLATASQARASVVAGSIGATQIAADGVTFAKIQNISTDRLIGRDTASSGDPEEISVGGGLEFTGSGGIRRSALTGDASASAGSNTVTVTAVGGFPLSASGDRWGVLPVVGTDGVMEVGRYIDFHGSDGDTGDNTVRLEGNGGILALTGAQTISAGTTSLAPLTLTSGTNLTTATAGAIEYDGKAFYATSVSSSRQIVNTEQISIIANSVAGSNVNTAQPIFGSTEDTVTLSANTTYEFEALYLIFRLAGTTSHTTGVLFGGTATLTSLGYLAQVTNPNGAALAAVQQIKAINASLVTLTAANTSAAENLNIYLRGTIRVNSGGTLIPQFQYSAAPGGAPTIEANTFFRCWPIGSNTVASVGNWS